MSDTRRERKDDKKMSMKAIWNITEWESGLLKNTKIPETHPLKAQDKFNLKNKKVFSTGREGLAVLAALAAFDQAFAKYDTANDVRNCEDVYQAMDVASRKFKSAFDAMNTWVAQTVNSPSKGFSKELFTEWTKMVGRKDKIAGEMHNAISSAKTKLETLKARPARPQTALPPPARPATPAPRQ